MFNLILFPIDPTNSLDTAAPLVLLGGVEVTLSHVAGVPQAWSTAFCRLKAKKSGQSPRRGSNRGGEMLARRALDSGRWVVGTALQGRCGRLRHQPPQRHHHMYRECRGKSAGRTGSCSQPRPGKVGRASHHADAGGDEELLAVARQPRTRRSTRRRSNAPPAGDGRTTGGPRSASRSLPWSPHQRLPPAHLWLFGLGRGLGAGWRWRPDAPAARGWRAPRAARPAPPAAPPCPPPLSRPEPPCR